MSIEEKEQLQKLFNAYGPEALLMYIKGACLREAVEIRKKSTSNSIFALGHEMIAKRLQVLLEGEKGEGRN